MQPDYQATAKLLNLSQEAKDILWRFRNPEEGGTKLTFEAILVELPKLFNVCSSLGALSYFYKEERQIREMQEAREFAERAQLEMLKDPEMSPDAAAKWAQFVFTTRVAADGNIKGFVALEKNRAMHRQIDLDLQKFELIRAKAERMEAAEAAIRNINSDTSLTPEAQRAAVLDKMDEFFGLKKKN